MHKPIRPKTDWATNRRWALFVTANWDEKQRHPSFLLTWKRVFVKSKHIYMIEMRKIYILIFVPTFVTKVTEYLCSGWVFFLPTKFDFLISRFWRNFLKSFKRQCCLELKFEKIFLLWSFFVQLLGFKDWHFGQFGTNNAQNISRN